MFERTKPNPRNKQRGGGSKKKNRQGTRGNATQLSSGGGTDAIRQKTTTQGLSAPFRQSKGEREKENSGKKKLKSKKKRKT